MVSLVQVSQYTVISAWNSMITPAVKWFVNGVEGFHTDRLDYWIELKRLLFKLFRITKFRTRSDKSIRSSILSKLKNYPFCQMWANRSICSYSDFNLAYVAEFQYKTRVRQKKNKNKKTGRYGNPQHRLQITSQQGPYRFVRPGPELCDSEQFKQ
jgi:hypothetical protein